jgi:hypothetical protein
MIENRLGNILTPPYTDYGGKPVAGGEEGRPVLRTVLKTLQMPEVAAFVNVFPTDGQAGLMPDDWLLDQPGISPYAGMTAKEGAALKAIENLFYSSYCMVLMVGDMVVQTTAISLKVKKNEIKLNMEAQLKEIEKKYAAIRKRKKLGFLGKIFRWVAVAVTAVICAASTALTGGAAAPAAVALFALTLSVAILEETDGMEKIIKGCASLLKEMGVNEKKADMIAGILVAVIIAVALIAASLAIPGAGPAGAATAIMMAAQIAMRSAEATNAAVQIASGATAIFQGLAKSDEFRSKARLNEINATTKSFEDQIQQLLEDMEEGQDHSEETKRLLLEAMNDISETTVNLINEAMGLNGLSSGRV